MNLDNSSALQMLKDYTFCKSLTERKLKITNHLLAIYTDCWVAKIYYSVKQRGIMYTIFYLTISGPWLNII